MNESLRTEDAVPCPYCGRRIECASSDWCSAFAVVTTHFQDCPGARALVPVARRFAAADVARRVMHEHV